MQTILMILMCASFLVTIILIIRMKQFRTIYNTLLNELLAGKNRHAQIDAISYKIDACLLFIVLFCVFNLLLIFIYKINY